MVWAGFRWDIASTCISLDRVLGWLTIDLSTPSDVDLRCSSKDLRFSKGRPIITTKRDNTCNIAHSALTDPESRIFE
ncbi:hypothetical protein CEXT_645541 [Caerostris extrusa]|uniref:Uncharacterized protein n=1 Tax=Caerostris extrusa TaxID=172846 RepID=A0AAV4XI88_CAEEX|nr:hypothetical protein CEXT_645541 [Caerostris extrusa]